VRVSYDEGVANHIGPEACAGVREGVSEALTGERTGQADRERPRRGAPGARAPLPADPVDPQPRRYSASEVSRLGHPRGVHA
jgi:hypothetical protein